MLYNRQVRAIGVRAVSACAEHSYSPRSATGSNAGRYVISAMAFLHYYDIRPEETMRWPAHLDGDVLFIDLNDQATPVTSNRAVKPIAPSQDDDLHEARVDELKAEWQLVLAVADPRKHRPLGANHAPHDIPAGWCPLLRPGALREALASADMPNACDIGGGFVRRWMAGVDVTNSFMHGVDA